MSFTGEVIAQLGWDWRDGATDNSKLRQTITVVERAADERAKAVWHRENIVVANGTPHLWDLSQLTRTVLGDILTVSFTRINYILFVNHGGEGGGNLIVGAAPFNAWWMPFGNYTDTVQVPAASPLLLSNRFGWEVSPFADSSSSSGDSDWDNVLQIASDAGSITYSIAIIGDQESLVDSSSSSGG